MQIKTFLVQYTGLTVQQLFQGHNGPLVKVKQNVAGDYSFPVWKIPKLKPPTSAQVIAALSIHSISELIEFAGNFNKKITNGGVSINVNSSGESLLVKADTSSDGWVKLLILFHLANQNLDFITDWVQSSGDVVTLNVSQIMMLVNGVANFYNHSNQTFSKIITAIKAGTIISRDQIIHPSLPISWPENS